MDPVVPQPASTPVPAALDQAALQELILSTNGVEEFLDELVQLAASGGAVSCGITVRVDDRVRTVASSDELASRADEVQYAQGEGPCLEAMRTGLVVESADLVGDDRWSGYRTFAVLQGVRSVLSTPMTAGGDTFGALNLYSSQPNAFDDEDRERAERWAQQASGAVGVALRLAERTRWGQQISQALTSRTVIDQAIGIVMAQQRCSAADAFGILRTASQGRNVKLRAIAADIVEAVGGPTGT